MRTVPAVGHTTTRKFFRNYGALSLMALPAVVYFIINNYMPMAGVVIAFKRLNYVQGIWNSPWVGLANFRFLFATPDAFIITRNTVLYNLVFIALNLILSVMVAILLNEISGTGMHRFYQSAFVVPYMVSYAVIGYVVYAFLSPDHGLLNSAIVNVFGGKAIDWYTSPQYWPYVLVLTNAWKSVGYGSILYLAAIVGIDGEFYEAALIDGAGRWQRIRYITIPMILPVVITLTLLNIGHIFTANFGLFYQTTMNSGMLPTTNVIDTYVYRALMNTGDMGMSSAAGFYQSIVNFCLVLLANAVVRKISRENALF